MSDPGPHWFNMSGGATRHMARFRYNGPLDRGEATQLTQSDPRFLNIVRNPSDAREHVGYDPADAAYRMINSALTMVRSSPTGPRPFLRGMTSGGGPNAIPVDPHAPTPSQPLYVPTNAQPGDLLVVAFTAWGGANTWRTPTSLYGFETIIFDRAQGFDPTTASFSHGIWARLCTPGNAGQQIDPFDLGGVAWAAVCRAYVNARITGFRAQTSSATPDLVPPASPYITEVTDTQVRTPVTVPADYMTMMQSWAVWGKPYPFKLSFGAGAVNTQVGGDLEWVFDQDPALEDDGGAPLMLVGAEDVLAGGTAAPLVLNPSGLTPDPAGPSPSSGWVKLSTNRGSAQFDLVKRVSPKQRAGVPTGPKRLIVLQATATNGGVAVIGGRANPKGSTHARGL